MDWIEGESVWLFYPDAAEILVWREALEGFEPAAEVVGHDEVGQVAAKLVVGFIVVALDGRFLEGAVHPFDLAIRPGVVGFGQAVLDAVGSADLVEAVDPIASGPTIAIARQVGE